MTLVLLSQNDVADATPYTALNTGLGNRPMSVLTADALAEVVAEAALDHPVRELLDPELDEALEDAAQGSAEAVRRLRGRGSPRRMTAEALEAAKQAADATGRAGEALLFRWFGAEVAAGRLKSAVWVSDDNAVNPWDFEVEEPDETRIRIEVKTTKGAFHRPFHVSQAEFDYAAGESAPRTDLYRLYEYGDQGASLRIAKGVREVAIRVTSALTEIAPTIVPDSYTLAPEAFSSWSEPIAIAAPEGPQEE
jgi:Domain of unknown function (DUF3883)